MLPDFLNIQSLTLVTQYLIGFLLACVPAVIWIYIFYSKDKDSRRSLLISFLGGILAVIPILVYMNIWNNQYKIISGLLPHLNIFSFIQTLVWKKDFTSFIEFSSINVFVGFGFFIALALLVTVLRLSLIRNSRVAIRTVLGRAFETPFQFIIIGLVVSILAYLFDFSAAKTIWYYILVGAMEEYVKFLVLRFLDDGNYKGADDVILQAVLIALGFAFLENIIYFVDKIWLVSCTPTEISQGICLYNAATTQYVKQVGVLLIPFITRSAFSTLAHVLFSSIFGYFYALAYFKKIGDMQDAPAEKSRVFGILYSERMILSGLVLAMVLHASFDLIIEWEMVYLIVPFLAGGYLLLDYLITKKHELRAQGLLSDDPLRAPSLLGVIKNIEILREFEDILKARVGEAVKKDAVEHLDERVTKLQEFEEIIRRDERDKHSLYLHPSA